MARTWLGFLLAVVTLPAFAGGPGAVRKQVESSMLVTGTISINADGSVASHALEQPDRLPPGVVDLVTRGVQAWRFEPIQLREGEAHSRAVMSVRVVAKRVDEDSFIVEIRGARFSNARPGEFVTGDKISPPAYPRGLGASGVGGEVYLIVKVGRSGEVEDVVAEQVNLFTLGSESQIARWRDQLAKSAVRTARQWTFNPPTKGAYVDRPFWLARVPVAYHVMGRHRQAEYGQWQAYVPGPHLDNPWFRDESAPDADAIAAGNVQPVDNAFRLLTPVQEG